jgi:hypothetical protein
MKAIKYEVQSFGHSVLVDTLKGFNVWIDISIDSDGQPDSEWNQYIFHLLDKEDVKKRDFQDDANNFMEVEESAIDYLSKLELI